MNAVHEFMMKVFQARENKINKSVRQIVKET